MQVVKMTVMVASILLLFSCQKEVSSGHGDGIADTVKVYKTPTSEEEIELVRNLGKVTAVLQELYKDKSNLKLVNASIFAGAYTDESILLKELIYPLQSRLNSNNKFLGYIKKWQVSLETFSANFWRQVNKTNDAPFRKFLESLGTASAAKQGVNFTGSHATSKTAGDEDEVSIYFPYSKEYAPEEGGGGGSYEPITTVITSTEDADEGWGFQPYYMNGILQYYSQVLVNDAYASTHPTQIIGINGIEPYDLPATISSVFPPTDLIQIPNMPREVKQVYVGDIRIHKVQYDKLLSATGNGGGSEMCFTRADGYLKVVDGHVQKAEVYHTTPVTIGRRDINNKNWVDVSIPWDGDWEADNLQQNFAIYEQDTRNSSNFNGALTTTITAAIAPITVTAVRTLGFTINYKSDDELIQQMNFNRDVFFILNRIDLEGEMRNGWPVRNKLGPVSFTFNDRTLK